MRACSSSTLSKVLTLLLTVFFSAIYAPLFIKHEKNRDYLQISYPAHRAASYRGYVTLYGAGFFMCGVALMKSATAIQFNKMARL